MEKKRTNKLFITGIIGLIVTAVCCATPVLVVLFGFLGLSAMVGYLDYVLLPLLFCFLILTGYAVMKKRGCDDQYPPL
ncbi:MAG: mercury resistance system transport protein MerF [bacterium]